MKIRGNSQIYLSKQTFDLLIREEGKRHYVLIKDSSTFMYDEPLNCTRKYFCHYCLQAFTFTTEILKSHVNPNLGGGGIFTQIPCWFSLNICK